MQQNNKQNNISVVNNDLTNPDFYNEFLCIYHNDTVKLKIYAIQNTEYVNYDIYNIPISKGLLAVRKIINNQYGKYCNPWCGCTTDQNTNHIFNFNKLTLESIFHYEWYSTLGSILLAFLNKKLIASYVNIFSVFTDHAKYNFKDNLLISYTKKLWFDLNNKRYYGVPLKIGNNIIEFNPNKNTFL